MQCLLCTVLSIGVVAGDERHDEAGSVTRACDAHGHPFFVLGLQGNCNELKVLQKKIRGCSRLYHGLVYRKLKMKPWGHACPI
jgi:uncharacterized protein (UPF0179 family)